MKMRAICCVATVLLMLAQKSRQNPLQDAEDKSRSFTAAQNEPLDDSRQTAEVKRHSQGTFTSDYSKYLDNRRAQDFVQWLMNTKRSGGVTRRHAEFERHADGTVTSDISSYLEKQATKEFIAWLVNGRGRRDFPDGGNAAEDMGRRHVDGSFTSDVNKVLDTIAAQEFLNWLINTKVTER
ncbi:pro-glucagon isoform X2 [Ambystoma mexicanum]